MTGPERFMAVMNGGRADRTPVMPKIWVDLGAALTGAPLIDVIEDPETALRVIVDAGLLAGVDAVRQFQFPARVTESEGDAVFEVRDGERIGEIDMQGGLKTHLDDPTLFNIEDPAWTAWHSYYTADAPFVASMDDVRRLRMPDAGFFEDDGWGDRQRRVMEHAADRVTLVGDCQSATLAFMVQMRGMQQALMDLFDNPTLAHALMEKGVEFAVALGRFNIDLGLRVLRLNDSVGNMSVISPPQWREFIFPHMKAVCDALHAYCPDVRLYCHICGNTQPILEDLVETGLDCIAPLDPLGGVDVATARATVGDDMVLMGGIDTQAFVTRSPDEIAATARACIAAGGDRYILGSGCVVPRTAPLESLLALREASLSTHR